METLAGCITFGCNIPFFVFAYAKKDIKPINQAYNKVIDRDIPINVGGILTSWNPMSHQKYWTDNDFTKPVARFIKTLL